MGQERLEFGPFALDTRRKLLLKNGVPLQQGQRALALLECLLSANGEPVSKDTLMEAAWPGSVVEESNLSVQIAALRKSLGPAPGGGDWIVTVQRLGYQLVLSGEPLTGPSAEIRTSPLRVGRPSIAVLPFDNISPGSEYGFFSDGLTEEITTALSRLKDFFVIARNTMFTYKGRPVNIQELGRELGVQYILEGSVRSAGGVVRVSAQLNDAFSGSQIWGERYDRSASDIFAIQDEITASVISRIGPELLAAEHARAARKPTGNLNAWECVVRGLFLSSRLSEEDSRQALVLLEQAISHDPSYARALGLMVWVRIFRAVQGWDDIQSAVAQGRALCARAMAADDNEPWSWIGRGTIALATRDSPAAIASMEKAVNLKPNFAMGLGLLSLALSFAGRPTEALRYLDHAVKLSPREVFQGSFAQQYAFAHFQNADYVAGLQHATHAHDLRPGHVYPIVIGAACAGYLGKTELASTLIDRLKTAVPRASAGLYEDTSPLVLPADRLRLAHGLKLAGLD